MRHFTRDRSPFRVRLACVKHAASVQSEPESNSPVQICSKDLRWTEIRISKFLPVRYSLVNEPHRFTRREAVVYAASFSLSTSFFIFAKVFFRGPVGATRWRERLYAPFRSHRQAFFPQKILWIYSMLTDYSINIPKRHIKMFAFFSSNILPPKNPATGNAGMGPSQCIHLPAFPRTSDTTRQNCRRSLPGSYLFQPIDGGELPMTALYLAFLLRRADLSFVRIRLPSSAIKKPGKVSPSRPVMADAPNPPRSGCCPRANSGHRPRHSSA